MILISLFGGAPSGLSTDGEPITIPVVMISGNDGYAILDELSPGGSFNSGTVNATLNADTTVIPSYTDAMTDFTSEGPARLTNDLKPDISAPGYDIQSTDAGTGNKGVKFSGTSMATPHVAGVAALLVQLHPKWSPEQIKAALMNQANQDLKDNLLGEPVSATVMGSGRVDAFASAKAVSLASPGEPLLRARYRLRAGPGNPVVQGDEQRQAEAPTTRSRERRPATTTSAPIRPRSSSRRTRRRTRSRLRFKLKPKASLKVYVRLSPRPVEDRPGRAGVRAVLLPPEHRRQRLDLPGRRQEGEGRRPPRPLARRAPRRLRRLALEIRARPDRGSRTRRPSTPVTAPASARPISTCSAPPTISKATARRTSSRSAPARSRATISATTRPSGSPTATTRSPTSAGWTSSPIRTRPTEPVEFGVQTAGIHNTTETLEVDVLVDAGADGVYAGDDEGIACRLPARQAAGARRRGLRLRPFPARRAR